MILKEEDVSVSNVRIDLTRGRQNPLERYLKKYEAFMMNLIELFFFIIYLCTFGVYLSPLFGACIIFQNQLF